MRGVNVSEVGWAEALREAIRRKSEGPDLSGEVVVIRTTETEDTQDGSEDDRLGI